jgi:DNA-binding response OmpR family regulator
MTGSRILIVEDEPVLVRALTDALAARGCDVTSATDESARTWRRTGAR